MATRKQVSDRIKSIPPTNQMQISLLYKNTRKTNIIGVVAYSMSLFLIKLNFRKQIVIFYH